MTRVLVVFDSMLSMCECSTQPEHAWGTGPLEICTLLENGRGMSGPELENLFHLGHARKHRERIDIDNAIYAHFGVLRCPRRLPGTFAVPPLCAVCCRGASVLPHAFSCSSCPQASSPSMPLEALLHHSYEPAIQPRCRHWRDRGIGEPELRHVRVHRQRQAMVGRAVWHGEPTLRGKQSCGQRLCLHSRPLWMYTYEKPLAGILVGLCPYWFRVSLWRHLDDSANGSVAY